MGICAGVGGDDCNDRCHAELFQKKEMAVINRSVPFDGLIFHLGMSRQYRCWDPAFRWECESAFVGFRAKGRVVIEGNEEGISSGRGLLAIRLFSWPKKTI
jgi:hypothetical protein